MKYETVKDIYEECSLMRTLENSDKKFYMDIQLLCKEYIQKLNLIEKMKCCQNCKKRNSCIKHNTFVYPEMTKPINYNCYDLDKWECVE